MKKSEEKNERKKSAIGVGKRMYAGICVPMKIMYMLQNMFNNDLKR